MQVKLDNALVEQEDVNAFHWLALALLSIFLIIVANIIFHGGLDQIDLVDLLQSYSLWSTTIGTIWIAAGVIYIAPPAALNPEQLSPHVIKTFNTASRHCRVGICVILFGFACQIVSGMEKIKKANYHAPRFDCRVWIQKKDGPGEAEHIKCLVDSKSEN